MNRASINMVSSSQQNLSRFDTTWFSVCNEIHKVMKNPDFFDGYFGKSRFLRIEESNAILGFPPFVGELVEQSYSKLILNILKKVHSEPILGLQFEEIQNTQNENFTSRAKTLHLNRETIQTEEDICKIVNEGLLYTDYTFDSFVVGNSNRPAFQAALAVAENPGNNSFNPLTIYGKTGLGKTHLLQGIAHFTKKEHTANRVHYTSAFTFLDKFMEYFEKNLDINGFYHEFADIDVLLIDDIQFLAGKKKTQESFYRIFNTLINQNKQIILTSDRLPNEIPDMQKDLINRFSGGLMVDITAPSLKTRISILTKKAKNDNIQLSDEVIRFMANKVTTNVRMLEGLFTKVLASSIFANKELGINDVKELFADFSRESSEKISIEFIQEQVAIFYDISANQLRANTRKKNIAYPRSIAMYLSRELTKQSNRTIGLHFGGRDHSTVISATKKVKTAIDNSDSIYINEINELTRIIQS